MLLLNHGLVYHASCVAPVVSLCRVYCACLYVCVHASANACVCACMCACEYVWVYMYIGGHVRVSGCI